MRLLTSGFPGFLLTLKFVKSEIPQQLEAVQIIGIVVHSCFWRNNKSSTWNLEIILYFKLEYSYYLWRGNSPEFVCFLIGSAENSFGKQIWFSRINLTSYKRNIYNWFSSISSHFVHFVFCLYTTDWLNKPEIRI